MTSFVFASSTHQPSVLLVLEGKVPEGPGDREPSRVRSNGAPPREAVAPCEAVAEPTEAAPDAVAETRARPDLQPNGRLARRHGNSHRGGALHNLPAGDKNPHELIAALWLVIAAERDRAAISREHRAAVADVGADEKIADQQTDDRAASICKGASCVESELPPIIFRRSNAVAQRTRRSDMQGDMRVCATAGTLPFLHPPNRIARKRCNDIRRKVVP